MSTSTIHSSECASSQFSQVQEIPSEVKLVDIMKNMARWQINVHNHGFIALVDCMPRLVPEGQTAEVGILKSARVSYGIGTKKVQEDRGLVRYLARHRHTTPSEMVKFLFHCRMPLFIARQWLRHRTANVNEYSARYSVVPDLFYQPTRDDIRVQSTSNRQGGSEVVQNDLTATEFLNYLDHAEAQYTEYTTLLDKGVCREQARIGLPLSTFTEFYWCIDLHNLMHFLSLRMDAHAQKEIQDYAKAIYTLIQPIVPVSMEAFVDYELESVRLTRLEVDAIRTNNPMLATTNKREQDEWTAKRAHLGLDIQSSDHGHRSMGMDGGGNDSS